MISPWAHGYQIEDSNVDYSKGHYNITSDIDDSNDYIESNYDDNDNGGDIDDFDNNDVNESTKKWIIVIIESDNNDNHSNDKINMDYDNHNGSNSNKVMITTMIIMINCYGNTHLSPGLQHRKNHYQTSASASALRFPLL